MKKEIAEKWAKALRSGEYEQGAGTLEAEGKFCCLGVLCKLAEKEGVELVKTSVGNITGAALHRQPAVMKWSGMKDYHGRLEGITLAQLNDDEELTFEQLADVIDQNWEQL